MMHSKNLPASRLSVKLVISLSVLFVLGVVTFIPFSGPVVGLSPISSALAAPGGCDKDGDGFYKDSTSCQNKYPYSPVDTYEENYDCDDSVWSDVNDCSDTSGGGNLGPDILMDCTLMGEWGDGSGDTLKEDTLGDYYHGEDQVNCSIGGPSVPWPIRLGVGGKVNKRHFVRKVDIVLDDEFLVNGYDQIPYELPLYLFREAQVDETHEDYVEGDETTYYPDLGDMEELRFNVRPYRDTQTKDGIHLLDTAPLDFTDPLVNPYEMGMTFRVKYERYTISVASRHFEGNEKFTGIACQTGFEKAILAGNYDVNGDGEIHDHGALPDVTVYLWPDDSVSPPDADNLPDGYTVTTGDIVLADPLIFPPEVKPGPRVGAVCSPYGDSDCGNPQAPSNCNFLGYAKVRFTLHAVVQ